MAAKKKITKTGKKKIVRPRKKNTNQKVWIKRRGFLIGIGSVGTALAFGIPLGIPLVRENIASDFENFNIPGSIEIEPTAWFEITPESEITINIPKVEMGQGIHTALAQIAAEELEVDWDRIKVVQIGPGKGMDDAGLTGASDSVSKLYAPLTQAAIAVREMLRGEAAKRLGTDPAALAAQSGAFFVHAYPNRRISYGQLIQNAKNPEIPDKLPSPKSSQNYRFIGKPMQRVDLTNKVAGKAIFGYDSRLYKMLYGAVARPETILGSLKSATPGKATGMAGVVKTVIREGFAGVVAESRHQAYAALKSLQTEFEENSTLQQSDIEAIVTVGKGKEVRVQETGDPQSYVEEGDLEAEYRTPMAVHVPMEPESSLVDVQKDKVRVWTSTQNPLGVQKLVSEAIDRAPETIEVIPTYTGGGFGRKLGLEKDAAPEAAILSAESGRPVHVGWNRTEDIQRGFFRPPTHHILRATLDERKKSLLAMEHQQASGDVLFPLLPKTTPFLHGADIGAWRGGLIPYDIPHKGTTAWRTKLPFSTGWWHGMGLLANVFAVESFMDEVARFAKVDPLEFRLQHLGKDEDSQRMKKALEIASQKSLWGRPLVSGSGQGIAACIDAKTIVVLVAEVAVDEKAEKIRVAKITAVVDTGLIINPDGATAMIEGNIMMGLSSTLLEEARVKDGRIDATNFDGYPILSMSEAPRVEVTLIRNGKEPFGLGEPPIGPVAAAVANAIFSSTGKRIRRLPLRFS